MKPVSTAAQLFAVLLWAGIAHAQTRATLNIDLSKPLHPVSPTLYGLMTEEINYSYDGGLYAEMVRNRTFQEHDWSGIAHWRLEELGDASASLSIDTQTGPGPALPTSLKLNVIKADATYPAAVLNEGWWGMTLAPNTTYKGSLYAKTDANATGPVTISLINDNSDVIVASTSSAPLTTDWNHYEFALKTGSIGSSSENHLRLSVTHPGTVWIDLVSLFPPTYKDRPNGNRVDLMQKLAAMKPAFLRLPGGNYLEGNDIRSPNPSKPLGLSVLRRARPTRIP
jgi:alpha-L-arabinofuranosidase